MLEHIAWVGEIKNKWKKRNNNLLYICVYADYNTLREKFDIISYQTIKVNNFCQNN